jgi:hypothetical protein
VELALLVVAQGEFHGVADIFQAAFFGDAKLDTAGDLAGVNVETRNDTFCNHTDIEIKSRNAEKLKNIVETISDSQCLIKKISKARVAEIWMNLSNL